MIEKTLLGLIVAVCFIDAEDAISHLLSSLD